MMLVVYRWLECDFSDCVMCFDFFFAMPEMELFFTVWSRRYIKAAEKGLRLITIMFVIFLGINKRSNDMQFVPKLYIYST